jgi:SAM-dependent methyltransferase
VTPAELGAGLRRVGLNARALAAWAGTDRLSALWARRAGLAEQPATPAGALLALFVGGAEVAAAALPPLDIAALVEHGLVERAGEHVRALVAVLPLGEGLLVCDRADTAPCRELACWPDDSSYHLARSLPPGQRARWLDLACGSAFAAIARPELAAEIVGTDLSPRSVALARLGTGLSGLAHVTIAAAAVGDASPASLHGGCDLVSCNAPIPATETDEPLWRKTDVGFVARALADARRFAAPGATIVVHAALDPLVAALDAHTGERIVVAYTPASEAGFGVAWWKPDAPNRLVVARRELTAQTPHLTWADREQGRG